MFVVCLYLSSTHICAKTCSVYPHQGTTAHIQLSVSGAWNLNMKTPYQLIVILSTWNVSDMLYSFPVPDLTCMSTWCDMRYNRCSLFRITLFFASLVRFVFVLVLHVLYCPWTSSLTLYWLWFCYNTYNLNNYVIPTAITNRTTTKSQWNQPLLTSNYADTNTDTDPRGFLCN